MTDTDQRYLKILEELLQLQFSAEVIFKNTSSYEYNTYTVYYIVYSPNPEPNF